MGVPIDSAIKNLGDSKPVFEERQKTPALLASTQSKMPAEDSFAIQIAAGMTNYRQGH
jgi:hypothetical protein